MSKATGAAAQVINKVPLKEGALMIMPIPFPLWCDLRFSRKKGAVALSDSPLVISDINPSFDDARQRRIFYAQKIPKTMKSLGFLVK